MQKSKKNISIHQLPPPYKTCTLSVNVNPTNGQLGGHPSELVALEHQTLVWERSLFVSGNTPAVRANKSNAIKHLQSYLSRDEKNQGDKYWYLTAFHIRFLLFGTFYLFEMAEIMNHGSEKMNDWDQLRQTINWSDSWFSTTHRVQVNKSQGNDRYTHPTSFSMVEMILACHQRCISTRVLIPACEH